MSNSKIIGNKVESNTLQGGKVVELASTYEARAASALEQLGLNTAREHLDQVSQRAAAENWTYSHFLGYLLDGEMIERHRKTVALNLQFAHFPYLKRLKEFDFDAQPGIDRRLIEELATGRFLHEGRNTIFLGPPGVGKTHLGIALGIITAELGHRVYFTTAIEMARKLTKAMSENRLHREIIKLTHPRLLIIDEVGYLTLDAAQSSLIFQVICKRYDKELPILLTSNKSFTDWGAIFGQDAVMASAALDRLLHRCTVINIRGESYRLKDRRRSSTASAGTSASTSAGTSVGTPMDALAGDALLGEAADA